MLYLKSLTMHRFKSFKHAELIFSKGFTCVVGPNGSGKSNICDAMLFGLGESSLSRLRARSLDTLITLGGSKSGVRKAYVTMEFDGEEPIKITRGIRSDGKSIYVLNGKKRTRMEIKDLLAKHNFQSNETSSITQGEINKINEMGSKERRELIDIASGIEEFERKKDEAIKELSKVGQRVSESQIVLEERTGFLKELEAEKAAAEKYLATSSRLKALNYSILLAKKEEAEATISEYGKATASLDSRKVALKSKLSDITKKLELLNQDRQQLTKELGESAKSMGAINAKLEALKMENARLEMEISSFNNHISEGEKSISEYTSEIKASADAIEKNLLAIAELEKTIAENDARLSKSRKMQENAPSGFADIEGLKADIANKERDLELQNSAMLSLKGESSRLLSEKESFAKEAKAITASLAEISSKRSAFLQKIKAEKDKQSSLLLKAKAIESEIDSLNKKISNSEESIIELKLKKASSQSRGSSSYDKIAERFGRERGFHGRVSDLCTYEEKYAPAVEAAAGARMEYIIVDSIKTADLIIKYLRENSLGRATFIPLEEMRPVKETKPSGSGIPLLSLVKFDAKLGSAFSFVFSNTLLVNDSQEAKALGIGNYRYVTLSGDIIEQSGIISGGAAQKRFSISGIEKQMKLLTESSISMKKELSEKTAGLFSLRKESAYAEAEARSSEKELSAFEEEFKHLESSKASISKQLSELAAREEKTLNELSRLEALHKSQLAELESSRKLLSETYNRNVELSKQLAKHGMSESDLEKLEALRRETESLKIRKAELQKENEMLEKKSAETSSRISSIRKSISEARKGLASSEKKLKETESLKSETENRIMSDNETSKKIYGKISAIDSEAAKLSNESSRLSEEHSITERQSAEARFKSEQISTRIADLSAELAAYKDAIEPVKSGIPEMEKEAIILNSKLAELGNVNLKAPEMFAEKHKSVEEALSKVETLESERHSILRMIEEIESKKLQTFMATLNDVSNNFTKLYGLISENSTASIKLENLKDPFNSGLSISVTSNNRAKIIDSMSGGEKSLLSLILIFSIHLCRPSGLYIFDEVDAALDKENSRKLSQLIKQMSSNAQFVVVSHNDSLIVNADTAIGVIKSEDESKAVGIEVSSIINRKK